MARLLLLDKHKLIKQIHYEYGKVWHRICYINKVKIKRNKYLNNQYNIIETNKSDIMERIKKSAIIFHCEDNFGENYKYVLVTEIGEEQEVISKEMKLSTEIYDYEIVSCFV